MSQSHPFPPPPEGKHGWPWDQFPTDNPATLPDGTPWPKISIVTPSYNQADFIEETIRSVLLQGYPNLEYIIIDGGSSDASVAIIQKYAPWLHFWISEPDNGQTQAINKGFSHSTGQIMAWLNSDDFYAPNALFEVAKTFHQNQTLWVAGITNRIDTQGNLIRAGKKRWEQTHELWYVGSLFPQPGVFWQRELWNRTGAALDESLQYTFDYDFWMRITQHQVFPTWLNEHVANFRLHQSSKSSMDQLKFMPERNIVYKRYPPKQFPLKTRFTIWKRRQERKTQIYMDLLPGTIPNWKRIWLIFTATPWKFFQKGFLQSLKSDKPQ